MATKWTPGTFRIAVGMMTLSGGLSGRVTDSKFDHFEDVEGETWGLFGIHEDRLGCRAGRYAVTHVPTGHLLGSADTRKRAKRFCTEIAPLTDWAAVTQGDCPEEIKPTFLTAWHRAHGAMFVACTCPEEDDGDPTAAPQADIAVGGGAA